MPAAEDEKSGRDKDPSDVVELELDSQRAKPPSPPPPKVARSEPASALPPPSFKVKGESTAPPAAKFPPEIVADIMTRKVIAIETESSLENVEEGMTRFGFHHLPIVDSDHKLVGLLSHTDLMHAVSSTLSANREARDALIRKRATVNQIMHRDVTVVRPDDSVKKAGDLMLEEHIGCVPVVDGDNALVGIVTRTDFLRLALEFLAG